MVNGMSMAKHIKVACQCRRVTRDIHDACYRVLHESIKDDLLTTCTRWVKHKPIKLRSQRWQQIFCFALENLHIAHTAQVPLCILDSAGRLFNGKDLTDMPGQQQRKGPHATINVSNGNIL